MEEREGLIRWIKDHKKELIIAGISIGTLILVVLGIRNQETVEALLDSLKKIEKQPSVKTAENVSKAVSEISPEAIQKVVSATTSNSAAFPFEVSGHIRNLHDGCHASPEKIAEAMKNGIILLDGQTWVDSYVKGGVAA